MRQTAMDRIDPDPWSSPRPHPGPGDEPVPSYAAQIAAPCRCPHDRHQITEGITCGGVRIHTDNGLYCYGCWTAVFRPHLALALDHTGLLRVLDFGRLDDLYRQGAVSEREAWTACGFTFPEEQPHP